MSLSKSKENNCCQSHSKSLKYCYPHFLKPVFLITYSPTQPTAQCWRKSSAFAFSLCRCFHRGCTLGRPYRLIRVQGCGEGGNPRSSQRLAGQLGPALITGRAGNLIQTPIVYSQPGETWSLITLGSTVRVYIKTHYVDMCT